MARTKKSQEITELAVQEEFSKPVGKKNGGDLTLEENSTYISHAWEGLNRQPVNMQNSAEVENRVVEYLMSCRNNGLRPNPPALASWLGITSEDLKEWLTKAGSAEHRKAAARVYQMLHQCFADLAFTGKVPPMIAIFLAKNWFGYSDVQRIETQSTMEKRVDLDKLAAEAEALPDGEIIDVPFKELKKK